MSCVDDEETMPLPSTRCDGDTSNNMWLEGSPHPVCLLDTMTDAQIINVIQRDEQARADLRRVTTDPHLLSLAENVPRLSTENQGDIEQRESNRGKVTPYYSVFRGRPPVARPRTR